MGWFDVKHFYSKYFKNLLFTQLLVDPLIGQTLGMKEAGTEFNAHFIFRQLFLAFHTAGFAGDCIFRTCVLQCGNIVRII
jgi:hypothetical protein